MTKPRDWTWNNDFEVLWNAMFNIPEHDEGLKVYDEQRQRISALYASFRGLKSKIKRHREVFGKPYGVYRGSCQNWVWITDDGKWSVWISTEGIELQVKKGLLFEEVVSLYRNYLDKVLGVKEPT